MSHLFIHAPPGNGTDGIILLHSEKTPGYWLDHEVEDLCRRLFPRHDYRDLVIHKNTSVSKHMVANYQLRRENHLMQRYSIEDTFEDVHYDAWAKIIGFRYPELAMFGNFMLQPFDLKAKK